MKFCLYCESILEEFINETKFNFVCYNCQEVYIPEPEDTLLYEENLQDKNVFIPDADTILDDPVSEIVEINCECGGKYGKQAIIGDDCIVITFCESCKASN